MSVRSNSDLGVKRDRTPVGKIVESKDELRDVERTQDALISAVPTEILALYTTLTGGILAVLIADEPASYLPYRWGLLGFAVLLTPVAVAVSYRRKHQAGLAKGDILQKTRVPWAEMSAATLAAAAWFLSAPGSPLLALLETDVAAMTSVAIVVGTTAIVWTGLGRQLRMGTLTAQDAESNETAAAPDPSLNGRSDDDESPAPPIERRLRILEEWVAAATPGPTRSSGQSHG